MPPPHACLLLGSLVGRVGRRINRTLVDAQTYAVGNLNNEIVFFYILDGAVDATGGNDFAAGCKAFAEFDASVEDVS